MKSIFVSSTFKDMQAERDALAHKVIPELNAYARNFGENIRFVDLRWGVNTAELESDEGSKKVLKVCLDEIDNTRPYMIILVGERYGWIPPQEMIKNAADNKSYCLYDFEKSVTELEIEYGALAEEGKLEQCLFYFREPLNKNELPLELQSTYIEQDDKIDQKLKLLKEKIKQSGAKIQSYSCTWDEHYTQLVVPESFCTMVKEDVITLFKKDFEMLDNLSWQEREAIAARMFMEQKAAQFSARFPVLEEVKKEVTAKEHALCIIQGMPGSGKSTLIAKLCEDLIKDNETFFFSCANSTFSQNEYDLLKQMVYKLEILLQIKKPESDVVYNEHEKELINNNDQKELQDWIKLFSEYAFNYNQTVNKPLYFFIDGLDQMAKSEVLDKFTWLPNVLPENITIVISCLKSFNIPSFYPLQEKSKLILLEELSKEEVPQIIESIVNAHGKELSSLVISAIADLKGCTNPLYISIALQRLLMLDKDDFNEIALGGNDMDAINAYMLKLIKTFPDTVEEVAVMLLTEASSRIEKEFCSEVIALLASSRRGLRESDLQEIFKAQNKNFSNIDFALFTKYMSNFFLFRNDGRVDFTHRIIREGLLEHIDVDECNALILACLKDLDFEDEIRLQEIVYHAYLGDDVAFVCDYISEYNYKNRNIIASEFHVIALCDVEWIYAVFNYAFSEMDWLKHFQTFFNNAFVESFSMSQSEYTLLAVIMEELIKISEDSLSKNYDQYNENNLIISYEKAGDIYKKLGDNEKAYTLYQKIIYVWQKYFEEDPSHDNHAGLAISYEKLGEMYRIFGKFDKAQEFFEKSFYHAEIIAQANNKTDSYSLAVACQKLGDIFKINGLYDDAMRMFQKYLKLSQEDYEKLEKKSFRREIAISYSRIASIYEVRGDYNKALEHYQKAHDLTKAIAQEERSDEAYDGYAIHCQLLGGLYETMGEYDLALQEYTKFNEISIKLAEKLGTPGDYRGLAISWERMAKIYHYMNKFEESMELHQKAFTIRKRLWQELNTVEAKNDLASSYQYLGNEYLELGENEKALAMQQKFLEIETQIHEELNNSVSARGLLLANFKVGIVYNKQNELDEALVYFYRALELAEEIDEGFSSFTATKDLVMMYEWIVLVLRKQEDKEKLIDYSLKEISALEKAFEKDKSNGYQNNLSYSYCSLGDVYLNQENYDAAFDMYQKRIAIDEKLIEEKTKIRYDNLSIGYYSMANYYQSINKDEEALVYFDKRLKLREESIKAYSEAEDYRNLSLAYTSVADTLLRLKQLDKVAVLYQKSVEIDEKLAEEKTKQAYNDLYVSYINMKNYYQVIENKEEALKYELKSLEVNEKMVPFFETPQEHKDLALSYLADAINLEQVNESKKALELYLRSIELYNSAIEVCDDEDYESLAYSYNRAATLYSDKEDFYKAFENYDEEMKIRYDLYDKNKDIPYYEALYLCYIQVGYFYCRYGYNEEALELFIQALEMGEYLVENYPSNEVYERMEYTYSTLSQIYDVLNDQEKKLAFEEKALKIKILLQNSLMK